MLQSQLAVNLEGKRMFHQAVRSICSSAGWKEPQADENGVYAFTLEGDMAFTLASPDGERLLARAVLLDPQSEANGSAGQEVAADTLKAVMRITAARFAELKAVPALNQKTQELEIYDSIPLRPDGNANAAHIEFVEGFLNDLAFWKAQPVFN
jgi:hypothetical protein